MPTPDSRIESIQQWLQQCWPRPLTNLRPASADASFRRYFRVDDAGGGHSLIVMDAPPEHEDCRPFVRITELIRGVGVNAPEILAQDTEQGFLLLEDLGSRTFLDHLRDNADALYSDAMDALIRMQGIHSDLPAYDASLLTQEMALLEQWYLNVHLGVTLDDEQKQVLENAMQLLVDNALEQPQVFVHRDYHSRNLMVTDANNPGVIDYQDAVVGAITYDLVSLFKDCYIEWPRERVEHWLAQYLDKCGQRFEQQQFIRWFDLMGVQRHLKVLGIFARLNHRDGKSQYLNDLPLTLKYVLNTCEHYAELHALRNLLTKVQPDT